MYRNCHLKNITLVTGFSGLCIDILNFPQIWRQASGQRLIWWLSLISDGGVVKASSTAQLLSLYGNNLDTYVTAIKWP